MKNHKELFAARLRAAMQKSGLGAKAAVLEREFNQRYYGKDMTLQGVGKWLKGQAIPSHDKILVLCEWLEVTPEELGFGNDIRLKVEQKQKRREAELSYLEREMLDAFLNLPVPQRKIVREVILAFAKAYMPKS